MCDPMTIAITSAVAATAAAGVSGLSQIQQANYSARIADMNASNARLAQRDALDRQRSSAVRLGARQAQEAGAQRAAMAANGVQGDAGTGLALQEDTALVQRQDRDALASNALTEQRGFDINIMNYEGQASAARASKLGIGAGTALQMGQSILGGVRQVNAIKAERAAGGTGWGTWR